MDSDALGRVNFYCRPIIEITPGWFTSETIIILQKYNRSQRGKNGIQPTINFLSTAPDRFKDQAHEE